MSLTHTTRALLRQAHGRGPADALAGPGDEGDAALEALEPAGPGGRHSTAPALGETTWPTMLVSSRSTKATAAAISSGWSTRPSGSASA